MAQRRRQAGGQGVAEDARTAAPGGVGAAGGDIDPSRLADESIFIDFS